MSADLPARLRSYAATNGKRGDLTYWLEEAAKEIERLRARIRELEAEREWRPIETVERNSRARLVWCPAYRNIYVVSWVTPLDNNAKPDTAAGFWSHFGGGQRLNERPTRFMPLPAPPQEDKP